MNKNMIKLEEDRGNSWSNFTYINANLITDITVTATKIKIHFGEPSRIYIFLLFPIASYFYVPSTPYNLEQLKKAGLID